MSQQSKHIKDHFTFKEWKSYLLDDMPSHKREKIEAHLYSCDHCLELYMLALEDESVSDAVYPTNMEYRVERHEEWKDTLINTLPKINESNYDTLSVQRTNQRKRLKQSLFQYTIAASITFFLMFSGTFHSIVSAVPEFQSSNVYEQEAQPQSLSDRMLIKTESMLNSIVPFNKGGRTNEQ